MDSSSTSLGGVNKSSLVSLKAELERKKQEIKKLQSESGTTTDGIANCAKYREKAVKKLSINERTNVGVASRLEKDLSVEERKEEEEEVKHCQEALEAKARIYEDLRRGRKVLETSNQVLVNFDEKRKEEEVSEESLDEDSDEEWTEFTDALGRTRKCLKTDLKHYQDQNKHLEQIRRDTESTQHKAPPDSKANASSQPAPPGFSAELLSFDMKRELMRKQWEEQEQKLEGKSSVHYQDILFDEARQHGVGYFRFSSDPQARAAEMEKLNAERAQTRLARDQAREMRRLRRRQFKTRLLMTENRKRESQGLPPLPLDVDNISSSEDEEDEAAEEEGRRQAALNDQISRRLEEIRKAHKTREWDAGKDGQMSQEEWVERQRAERKQEFAPPTNQDGGEGQGDDGKWRGIDGKQNQRGERKQEFAPPTNQDGGEGGQGDDGKWRGSDGKQNRKVGGEAGNFSGDVGEKVDDQEENTDLKFSTTHNRRKNAASSRDTESKDSSLSDEQLLKQLETEEAYSANSIFCFKRKWADRNKEVFRRYQKPSKSEGKETSVETAVVDATVGNSKRRTDVQNPLVDTRFINNSCVNKASDSSFSESSSKDVTCDDQEIGVGMARNHASFETVKRSKVPHKPTSSSLMEATRTVPDFNVAEESVDDDLIGPPIPTELIAMQHIEAESLKERRRLVQKENEDDDLIGPPIPKQLLAEPKREANTSGERINDKGKNEDLIGPPIPTQLPPKETPKDPIELTTTSQLSGETKAPSKPIQLIPTQITKDSKSSLIPSKLIPRQIHKAPLIPTNLRPRQIASQHNAFLKTGKLPNTNKESVIDTSKSNSAILPEENKEKATSEEEISKPIDDTDDQSKNLEKKGVLPNEDTGEQEREADVNEQITCHDTVDTTSNLRLTASNNKTSDLTKAVPSSEPDPEPNTTFNFLGAKSKSDSLKRKLDRPNVQFDASGRLVNKTNQADRFRSLSRGAEAGTSGGEDSRTSSKRAEIAPPSSMEYFTSAGSFSSRGKRRGGGPGAGRGMMESLKVGMEKVEAKKKMRGERKEKGLLDIM